jgi:hypothetical protein
MTLEQTIRYAKDDLKKGQSYFYYKTTNGQWMFASLPFANLNGLVGATSYEAANGDYFELKSLPTNKNPKPLCQVGDLG